MHIQPIFDVLAISLLSLSFPVNSNHGFNLWQNGGDVDMGSFPGSFNCIGPVGASKSIGLGRT